MTDCPNCGCAPVTHNGVGTAQTSGEVYVSCNLTKEQAEKLALVPELLDALRWCSENITWDENNGSGEGPMRELIERAGK